MKEFLRSAWIDIFKKQENLELYLALIVIVAVFFADIFGLDVDTAYTNILLASLALLIYGMIETRHVDNRVEHILEEQAGRLNRLERKLAQLGQARAYLTRADSYAAFLETLNDAAESIDIVSNVNLRAADFRRTQYYHALRNAIESRHVSHQRIVWNLDQLLWLEQMLNEGWNELSDFSVKYYRVNSTENPVTTFDLIDQNIVFFGQGWLIEGHLEIVSPDVGQYFRGYFASLWGKSDWIKERGKTANQVELKRIIQELSQDE